jgi:hypothetical protein
MLGYLTFENMRQQVGRMIGDTVTSNRQTIINDWLNTNYDNVARAHRWPSLTRASESELSFTAGERFLYLPQDLQEMYFLYPKDRPELPNAETPSSLFHRTALQQDSSGVVRSFAPAGEYGRKADFHTDAELITVSPDASETAASVDHRIEGLDSAGVPYGETVNTATNVSANTSATFTEIFSISTNGLQTLKVTYSGATSTNEYAVIPADEQTARYKRIRLYQLPDTADTYTLYYKKRVKRLIDDDQIPEIPVSHVIMHMTVADQFRQQRRWQVAAVSHEQKAQQALEQVLREEFQGSNVQQSIPYLSRTRNKQVVVIRNG